MKSSTSLTLLQRLKSVEDTDAWTLANQLYSPLIARWARKAGLDDISADDVAQDVFMTLFREMPTFQYDKTKGKFRSWLKTITINRVRSIQRKKQPETPGSAVVAAGDALDDSAIERMMDEEFNSFFYQHALRIMRRRFPERTWMACWETTVNSRSGKDVGTELNMSEEAVFVSKSRVLRKLREELSIF